MRFRNTVRVAIAAVIGLAPFTGPGGNLDAFEDEGTRTAQSKIYSNAVFIEEAGDVVGYELAVQQNGDTSASALLYVYEGVPNEDGIYVSGHIAGRKLTMEGDWVKHLIEMPANKEVVETDHVAVNGTLDSNWFRGTIKIGDLSTPISVKLKHLNHIWMCRG